MNSQQQYNFLRFLAFIYACIGFLSIVISLFIGFFDLISFIQFEFAFERTAFFQRGGGIYAVLLFITGLGLYGIAEMLLALRETALNSREQLEVNYGIRHATYQSVKLLRLLSEYQYALLKAQGINSDVYNNITSDFDTFADDDNTQN